MGSALKKKTERPGERLIGDPDLISAEAVHTRRNITRYHRNKIPMLLSCQLDTHTLSAPQPQDVSLPGCQRLCFPDTDFRLHSSLPPSSLQELTELFLPVRL